MPVSVRKSRKGGYDIVETATGKVKGHSETRAKAEYSAHIRNAASKRK